MLRRFLFSVFRFNPPFIEYADFPLHAARVVLRVVRRCCSSPIDCCSLPIDCCSPAFTRCRVAS